MAQGILAVLGLVAGLGIFDEDFLFLPGVGIGVLIAQTHTRLHLVHILASGTAASECIPRHQCRFDLNLYGVIDQRGDEHRGKRGHTLALGVIRRHAHKAVHPVLTFKIPVGKIALHIDDARLYTGFVTFQKVGYRGFVTMLLAIAQIHAHKHRSPVLALGAPCA